MEAVYVLEPGAYIRREGETLKVVKGKEVIQQIPASGLEKLTLVGYVSLSGAVLDFLIQKRIETVFMTPTGRFRARLGLDEHLHVARRKAQYLRLNDPGFSLETARIIVQGKLENMRHFLNLRARQYGDPGLRVAAARIKAIRDRVAQASDVEGLRGLEGLGSRAYFQAFQGFIKDPTFTFSQRTRRPPLDPVNALLSFVYTLLTNEVLSALKACGLDPYLGALHEISYGRPSLACDLVEEYRSFLGDRLVLGLINRKSIRADDFVYRKGSPSQYVDEQEMKEKRPVEMKPAVGRAFISAYEEMMNRRVLYPPEEKRLTYRWLIHRQARAFVRYLEDSGVPYKPFTWEA
ncbi:MAG: CRISPR-associated endonuclease Cas1 [Desulfatiglandales bacterium]